MQRSEETEPGLKTVCVIPARLASTRLNEKPLVDVAGKPLIQRVYENIAKLRAVDEVIVAADDIRIIEVVKGFAGQAILTPKELKSGTDRVAYVCKETDADVIVNVQCDEPLVRNEMLLTGIKPFVIDPNVVMGSLKTQITFSQDLFDPNVVKVVTDSDDNALYFSRLPIPYLRDRFPEYLGTDQADDERKLASLDMIKNVYYKHLGIYFYRPDFLLQFSKMPESALERAEKLEQLRALENGFKIKVPTTEFDSIGIDTEEDLEKVRKIYQNMER